MTSFMSSAILSCLLFGQDHHQYLWYCKLHLCGYQLIEMFDDVFSHFEWLGGVYFRYMNRK